MDLRVAPRRLCPFYEGRWELLNGLMQGTDFDIATALKYTDFYRCADGRFVLPQSHYPKMRRASLAFLGTLDDREQIAAAIAQREARELEDAAGEAGVVLAGVRTVEEFLAEAHFRDHLAHAPLIELERIGDADPIPLATPRAGSEAGAAPGTGAAFAADQPLAGVRALGMAKVIAGGGIGRTLALHGADVLNVWKPTDYEAPAIHHTAQYGVRSVRLPWWHEGGRAELGELLRDADVFYSNRRPRLLDQLGLNPEQVAAHRPGIVHATVSVHGHSGPWAGRPGFDQTAGTVTGMMALEGSSDAPQVPVINVVNDWIVPWLSTAGIAAALARRAEEGGSWRVHVSLTRVAVWMLSLGIFDRDYVRETAGRGELHAYVEPELFEAQTPLGHYRGVTEQVRMSRTPGSFARTIEPIGASRPQWLDT
jgi:crotonobetainyl-CoA:carnitine CoA-transferase CaiB-like acyl-CoA transferase